MVSGKRRRPNPAPFEETHETQAAIDAAKSILGSYIRACKKAARLIAESIFGYEKASSVIEVWEALRCKNARQSDMEAEAAHMALLSFQQTQIKRAAGFIPVYNKVEGKVVIIKRVSTGFTEVALLSETK